ncbi:fms-related tyrosine kinase 3 ligand isoform X2 [Pelobates cultripes]|uniref:Fms-related tyrosine kinase 3 ligand isoform X2 n=1 Tax=Pelobates cultripes TaxID=61616 RepID=A0AAD1WRG6_PELCU|nr:fms-related tyrosine kinase 3 ligand isoform X2 [Pelobates cultripes]
MGGVKKIQPVSLFLLFLNLGTCLSCKPKYWSLTSHYDNHINNLENNFALDYPTYTVPNLLKDSWCSKIWIFHFSHKELSRIKEVSGENLKKDISLVLKELEFLNDCSFNISEDCLEQRSTNMSEFLDAMRSINIKELTDKRDYSNCTEILCDKVQDEPNGFADPGKQEGQQTDVCWPWIAFCIVLFFIIIVIIIIIIYIACQRQGNSVRRQDDLSIMEMSPFTPSNNSNEIDTT